MNPVALQSHEIEEILRGLRTASDSLSPLNYLPTGPNIPSEIIQYFHYKVQHQILREVFGDVKLRSSSNPESPQEIQDGIRAKRIALLRARVHAQYAASILPNGFPIGTTVATTFHQYILQEVLNSKHVSGEQQQDLSESLKNILTGKTQTIHHVRFAIRHNFPKIDHIKHTDPYNHAYYTGLGLQRYPILNFLDGRPTLHWNWNKPPLISPQPPPVWYYNSAEWKKNLDLWERNGSSYIELKFNTAKLFQSRVTLPEIAAIVDKHIKAMSQSASSRPKFDCRVIPSNTLEGKIHIHLSNMPPKRGPKSTPPASRADAQEKSKAAADREESAHAGENDEFDAQNMNELFQARLRKGDSTTISCIAQSYIHNQLKPPPTLDHGAIWRAGRMVPDETAFVPIPPRARSIADYNIVEIVRKFSRTKLLTTDKHPIPGDDTRTIRRFFVRVENLTEYGETLFTLANEFLIPIFKEILGEENTPTYQQPQDGPHSVNYVDLRFPGVAAANGTLMKFLERLEKWDTEYNKVLYSQLKAIDEIRSVPSASSSAAASGASSSASAASGASSSASAASGASSSASAASVSDDERPTSPRKLREMIHRITNLSHQLGKINKKTTSLGIRQLHVLRTHPAIDPTFTYSSRSDEMFYVFGATATRWLLYKQIEREAKNVPPSCIMVLVNSLVGSNLTLFVPKTSKDPFSYPHRNPAAAMVTAAINRRCENNATPFFCSLTGALAPIGSQYQPGFIIKDEKKAHPGSSSTRRVHKHGSLADMAQQQ